MARRRAIRLLVAAALVVAFAQGGGLATAASAATVNQCAGTGPEPNFWPAPLGASGAWGLTINGSVTCASPLNVPEGFQLQLTCINSVEGQCAGPVAFSLFLGPIPIPCTGLAVQKGFDFTGSCVVASFNFDYLPLQWTMVVTIAST